MDGERTPAYQIQGTHGDKRLNNDGELVQVGAERLSFGARLAVSDQETKEKNRESVTRYLNQLKKKYGKEQQDSTTE